MSTRITLTYNPYCQSVSLWGDEGSRMTPRLSEFLRGSMDDWLDYRTVSYQCWNGLLPEVMQELNDDALEITFVGTREDYVRLEEGLRRQSDDVAEYGYEGDAWTLAFEERFEPEAVLKRIRDVARENEAHNAPSQDVAEKRDFRRRELERCTGAVAEVGVLWRKWMDLFDLAVKKADDAPVREAWQAGKDKLEQAIER